MKKIMRFLNKILEVIKSKIFFFMYFFVGLVIILNPFYLRLLKNRVPRNLEDLSLYFSYFLTFLYFFSLVLLIFKVIKYKFFKDRPPNKVISYVYEKTLKPINTFISDCLDTVDSFIKDDLLGPNYLGVNMYSFAKYIFKHFGLKYKTYRRLFIFLIILPRIFMLFIFFYDVVICNQIKYTYFFAWILLVPLISKYVLSSYRGFAEYNIREFCEKFCTVQFLINPEEHNPCAADVILNECCKLYQADIHAYIPKYILFRDEAIVINVQRQYLLRDSTYDDTMSPPEIEAKFDEIMLVFTVARQIRDIVYDVDTLKLFWKYLYYQLFLSTMYLSLWSYITYKLYLLSSI